MPEAAVMPPTPPVLSPPSPLRSQMNRPQLPRRQSRFTEDMTGEHTPAPSVYEPSSPLEQEAAPSMVSARSRGAPGLGPGSTYTYTPSAAPSREYRPIELIARGMNGCLHGAACVILIAIMVEFLAQWDGFWFEQISAQAVALLVFLGVDTLLDIVSLVRLHKEWAFWALLLRFVTAVVYLTLFVVYAAHGRVFPSGYTFWAMSPTFSGPVVYVFLWLLGYVSPLSLSHFSVTNTRPAVYGTSATLHSAAIASATGCEPASEPPALPLHPNPHRQEAATALDGDAGSALATTIHRLETTTLKSTPTSALRP